MLCETVQTLSDADFKRSTGVRRPTFDLMLTVVEHGLRDFGRPPKLSRADQLLMTLMYWREYRTEFHIGLTYGVSESTVCRTIRKLADCQTRSQCEGLNKIGTAGWRLNHQALARVVL